MYRAILGVSMFLLGQPALAGWASNGGDESRDQRNIWFLDVVAPAPANPIEYCVEAAADFGQTESALKVTVAAALRQWRDFFNDYGAYQANFSSRLNFPDGQRRRLALSFKEVVSCSEDRTDQIAFLFGKSNTRLDEYLKLEGEYSLGIALRRPYDDLHYRTGGYVWIGKKVGSDALRTRHMLLHELGHVFGMPHNSVFVMDERVADFVLSESSNVPADLGKIETDGWFFRFRQGMEINLTYGRGGGSGFHGFVPNRSVPGELAQRLGLSQSGHLRVKLRRFADGRPGDKGFTLIFDELVGGDITTRHFEGELQLTTFDLEKDLGSPGLFTEWLDGQGNRRTVRVSVGFKWGDYVPASGFFSITKADGTDPIRFAANLTSERSPVLRVFLPESGQWWAIRSFDP